MGSKGTYAKAMNNLIFQFQDRKKFQYSVIGYMEKESEKEWICVYV